MNRSRVLVLLVAAVVVDVAYWTVWFTDRSLLDSETTDAYVQFENAFPLADAWLGLCCVLAATCLVRRSAQALLWLLAAGSAAAYLLGMDVLYDLQHGIWWSSGVDGVIELAVNVATAVLSAVLLTWGWRNREELQAT
jgi:hypothetical protein